MSGSADDGNVSEAFKVLALGGDHIGPDVVAAGLRVLRHVADQAGIAIEVENDLLGGASWDVHGTFCTDAVLEKARRADAILVGAVGGPKWDGMGREGAIEESDGLTRLRIELDVYNALRPAKSWKALHTRTPFRPEIIDGADILVIRENSGGIYYGEPRGRETMTNGVVRAFEISEYTVPEIERIARCAFAAARSRRNMVTSLEKSNVMETGMLWRETVTRVGRDEYPDVQLHHMLMDYALFAVTCRPRDFDVVLADNLFGDLISDMVGSIAGSLGMLPSATLPCPATSGGSVTGGIFEPTHGSAPDISGKGIANPMGTILSVAMMFDYAFGRADLARGIERAVDEILNTGVVTPDLGGEQNTTQVTDAVIGNL
jgi:3-isopropylmalate dehydrogenase